MDIIDVTHLVQTGNSQLVLREGTTAKLKVFYRGRVCEVALMLINAGYMLEVEDVITIDTSDLGVFGVCRSYPRHLANGIFVECIKNISFAFRVVKAKEEYPGIFSLVQFKARSFCHASLPIWLARDGSPNIALVAEVIALQENDVAILEWMQSMSVAVS